MTGELTASPRSRRARFSETLVITLDFYLSWMSPSFPHPVFLAGTRHRVPRIRRRSASHAACWQPPVAGFIFDARLAARAFV
jgi:hypothetical protein